MSILLLLELVKELLPSLLLPLHLIPILEQGPSSIQVSRFTLTVLQNRYFFFLNGWWWNFESRIFIWPEFNITLNKHFILKA